MNSTKKRSDNERTGSGGDRKRASTGGERSGSRGRKSQTATVPGPKEPRASISVDNGVPKHSARHVCGAAIFRRPTEQVAQLDGGWERTGEISDTSRLGALCRRGLVNNPLTLVSPKSAGVRSGVGKEGKGRKGGRWGRVMGLHSLALPKRASAESGTRPPKDRSLREVPGFVPRDTGDKTRHPPLRCPTRAGLVGGMLVNGTRGALWFELFLPRHRRRRQPRLSVSFAGPWTGWRPLQQTRVFQLPPGRSHLSSSVDQNAVDDRSSRYSGSRDRALGKPMAGHRLVAQKRSVGFRRTRFRTAVAGCPLSARVLASPRESLLDSRLTSRRHGCPAQSCMCIQDPGGEESSVCQLVWWEPPSCKQGCHDARLPYQLQVGLCRVSLETPRNCSSGVQRISRDLWCVQIHDGGLQRGEHDCVAAHWLGTGCSTGNVARGPRGASTSCMVAPVSLSARTALSPSLACVGVCVLVDAEKSAQGQPDLSGDQ